MADNVMGIAIVAKLDQFRAELAKMQDIGKGEARALTAAISKEIKALEKTAKQAGNAAKETTKNIADFGDTAGKAGSNAAKLAGALDLVAPGAGGVARGFADIADVGEVAAGASAALGVSLGTVAAVAAPIALLVGGIALAWSEYEAEADRARESQEKLLVALGGVDDIAKNSKAEINKLRVNLGQWTQAQYDDAAVNRQWDERLDKGTEALRAHRDELIAATKDISSTNKAQKEHAAKIAETNKLIESATTLNEQGRAAALANAEIKREEAESEEVLRQRLEAKSEASQRAAKTSKKHAEAEREAAAAMREAAQQASNYRTALENIGAIAGKAQESELDAYEELAKARDDQMASIMTQQQAAVEAGLGNADALAEADTTAAAAREEVWKDYYRKLEKYNKQQYDKADAERKAGAQKEAAHQAQVVESSFQTAVAVADAVSMLADTMTGIAEDGTENQKKLAMVSFRIGQGAAIASASITTAKAALDAYAAALQLGPPGLILAPIAAGAAVTVGIAQVAKIAAEPPPKFHRGMAPDEIPATLTKNEGVLTPQGVASLGGPDGVRRANRGESSGGQQIVVVQQYNHKLYDAAIADNLKMPTSPLRMAMAQKNRVGHRRRSS